MVRGRIIIAEDESLIAMDLNRLISSHDFSVLGVFSAAEDLVESLKKDKPDLILMDITLRGEMNGIQAAEIISAEYDIPVIYLTAHNDPGTIENSKKTNPYAYILKPYEEGTLIYTIEMSLKRHRLEKEVRNHRNLLSSVIEGINDGVIAVNASSQITMINKSACAMLNINHDDSLGENIADFYMPKLFSQFNLDGASIPEISSSQYLDGISFKNAAGREYLISETISPMFNNAGIQKGIVVVLKDNTEKIKAEKEIYKAQRLESIGILAGSIAHDFNNLLTAVLGNLSLAANYIGKDDVKAVKMLGEVEKAANRSKDLTQQLISFSKRGTPFKKEENISTLLVDVARFAVTGTQIDLVFDIDEKLPNWDIDKGQISQVVHNLVINARQAMNEKGRILITAHRISLSNTAGLSPGNYMCITVQDNGPGIEAEILDKVFDPYFTTKDSGDGLGLASSYSIVRKHGGLLCVESAAGAGAKFIIYLPEKN